MSWKGLAFSLFVSFSLAVGPVAHADLETTATLPQGVRSPVFLFGYLSGLTDHFTSDGRVEGVGDRYHLQLTGQNLSALDPRLAQLVSSLNAISNQRYGDQLSIGTIGLQANPVVNYFAPQFAYGLTEHLSIGAGIPIIHYRNDVGIVAGGKNNAQAIHNAVGSLSTEADSAFNELSNINLIQTVQQVIASKGYQPIQSEDTTAVGDLVISGVWQYMTTKKWKLGLRPFVQVPTGTKDNPDDLVDIPTGGQPAIGLYSIHDFYATPRLVIESSIGYQANIQDTADVRVPTGPGDILPGADRKETVRRRTGNSTYLEGGARYKISMPLEVGTYYDITSKDPDWYAGGHDGWDYSLLSQDTGSLIHQLKGALTFSTTDWFTKHLFAVPFQAVFVYGQTIYGENTAFSTVMQLYLRMFF